MQTYLDSQLLPVLFSSPFCSLSDPQLVSFCLLPKMEWPSLEVSTCRPRPDSQSDPGEVSLKQVSTRKQKRCGHADTVKVDRLCCKTRDSDRFGYFRCGIVVGRPCSVPFIAIANKMPPKKGATNPAQARGRYQKKSLSPSRGGASPKKGRKGEVEGKDMATILEEERKKAKKAMHNFAEQTLDGIGLGNIDVDLAVREGIETLCREYLQWLSTPVGEKAKADEYTMKLGEMKGSLERAIEITRLKRQEAPLALNIFEHDHIIITDRERQVESAIKNGNAAELSRLLSLQRGRALINNRDEAGWTSLHHAVAGGQPDLVSLILYHDADVNQENNQGVAAWFRGCYI